MPFTIDEIESLFKNNNQRWPAYMITIDEFKKSIDYETIVNFLTAKTNQFQLLDKGFKNHMWGILLIPHLSNIKSPNEKEQLILDLIYHPDMDAYMQNVFLDWLLDFAFDNPDEQTFKEILKRYYQYGLQDEDIFNHIIYYLDNKINTNTDNLLEKVAAIKDFLNKYLLKQKQLPYPKHRHHSYHTPSWNLEYFKILEEIRPDFTNEYAGFGALYDSFHQMPYFAKYKNGEYLAVISEYLNNVQNQTPHIIEKKFEAALYLFKTNKLKYLEFIVQQSETYLNHYRSNFPTRQWENNFQLEEFNGTALQHTPYTTSAFYLLLKHDKEKTIEILDDWLANNIFINNKTIEIYCQQSKQDTLPFIKKILLSEKSGADYLKAVLDLLIKYFEPNEYLDFLWSLCATKSKPLREKIAILLAEKDPKVEARSIILLENKKTETRQTAAIILSKFNTPNSRAAIIKTINQETNDNTRDILLATVAHTLPPKTTEVFVEEMIEAAAKRGKLTKPQETWLDETELPHLYYQNKQPLNANAIRFLIYRMSRVKIMQSDIEAKYLIQLLDKETAAPFAKALIKIFIDKGAKPDYKYLLAIAALLGNDEIVDFISRTINKWIEENRYKMAEYGVGALAIQGSNKALRKVEWYSRKYKAKKANVGAAALLALETAAEELGITTHELGDRVVPDFGFEGLFKPFEIEGEEFRAFIDSNFKIAYFNDDNKKLKALPANVSKELKEEFKDIGKEVRDIVKSQSSRLEYYLIIQRHWTVEQWQNFFLQNPVMFIYATQLLWGIYDSLGNLTSAFLCMEDTSLINIESDEIELPEGDSFVGMVHPTQLSAAELQAWKKLIFDQSIQPIFSQLDRPTADMTDIDMNKAIITKFNERQTENESIRSTLEKRGWHKGPTGDGGMIESYNLLYFEKRLEAVLEIEGVGAGYGWGGDEKLGKLYVINKSKVTAKWFSSPQKDDDESLIKLKDVPVIFLNEILTAVEAIKPKTKIIE